MSGDDKSDLDDFLEWLQKDAEFPAEEIAEIRDIAVGRKTASLPERLSKDQGTQLLTSEKHMTEEEITDIRVLLQDMKLPEKVKLALFGNATARTLLIQDSNRMVQLAVLRNPKIQEMEIEAVAKNPNLSDMVLRAIADNKSWMKFYPIKLSIVMNPKTPNDVALRWLRHLQKQDMRLIAKSKNLPQLIATTAKKILAAQDRKK